MKLFSKNLSRSAKKKTAVAFILMFVIQLSYPTFSLALTEGPSSPEFSSFEPVGTTDMVNVNSGDFVYNMPILMVPGTKGGGYPLSLSYHGGVNAEAEASWVGLGWTLNPGAINRGLSGIPDDYNGNTIFNMNKTWPIWTKTISPSVGAEISSNDRPDAPTPSEDLQDFLDDWEGSGASFNIANRYNSMKGFSVSKGVDLNWSGGISANLTKGTTDLTANLSVSPLALAMRVSKKFKKKVERFTDQFKVANDDYSKAAFLSRSISNATNKLIHGGFKTSAYNLANTVYNNLPNPGSKSYGFQVNHKFNMNYQFGAPISVQVGFERTRNVNFQLRDQKNQAYGWLNLHNYSHHDDFNGSNPDEEYNIRDFHLENDNAMDINSKSLPVPTNSYDAFNLSGEGLSGSFRFYRSDNGFFSKPFKKSKTKIRHAGFELGLIDPLSFGLELGLVGRSSIKNTPHWWEKNTETDEWLDDGDREPNFKHNDAQVTPAFIGDFGGIRQKASTNLETFTLPLHWTQSVTLEDNSDDGVMTNESQGGDFLRTSSNISYNKLNTSVSGRFNKNVATEQIDAHVGTNPSYFKVGENTPTNLEEYNSAIREFQIINKSGMKYIYGLPVFNKNEVNYVTDYLGNSNEGDIVYKNMEESKPHHNLDSDDASVYSGSFKPVPYSGTHLLTHIAGLNYADTDGDPGPTDDDLGGWTKFDYKQAYGEHVGEYYRWRAPYTGLSYSMGDMSHDYDNIATASHGEKEVYYLDAIETESHLAFFIKNNSSTADFSEYFEGGSVPNYLSGSGEVRFDGLGAFKEASNGYLSPDPVESDIDYNDRTDEIQPLEYLEKIVLISKSEVANAANADDIKFISSTNFEYDYSLVRKVPNNIHFDPSNPNIPVGFEDKVGKLTLKKVWTDYGGVYNAAISPFEFDYEYMTGATDGYPEAIKEVYSRVSEYSDQFSSNAQNPNYQNSDNDPWGFHMYDAEYRTHHNKDWLYQGKYEEEFDPAAWHLKRISLPSGGEIHVQYEENDYSFVQDKNAMALVSLDGVPAQGNNERIFRLNLEDIGLTLEAYDGDVAAFEQALQDQIDLTETLEGERGYFKFLYSLFEEGTVPSFTRNLSEYVEGYAIVETVTGSISPPYIEVQLAQEEDQTPREAAYYQFLSENIAIGESDFRSGPETEDVSTVNQELLELYNYSGDWADWAEGNGENPWQDLRQTSFNEGIWGGENNADINLQYTLPQMNEFGRVNAEHSYFKIPLYKAKRGAGIRVKRLLSYSPGIKEDNSDSRLYGVEYVYQTKDGRSSGVVSFEPQQLAMENPFTTFLPKFKQSALNRIVSGKDREQMEGPIAPSLYPHPRLIYGRVVAQNIANSYDTVDSGDLEITVNSQSGSGHTEYCFYTAKDFPVKFSQTSLNPKADRQHFRKRRLNLPLGIINIKLASVWAAQGVKMERNNMHGLPLATRTFSNNYDDANSRLISSQEHTYFEPGELVPTAIFDGGDVKAHYESRATEVDQAFYKEKVKETATDLSMELDVHLTFKPPFIFPTAGGLAFSYTKAAVFQISNSKIVDHFALPKATISFSEGTYARHENLLFDKATGMPVLASSHDAHHGAEINGVVNDGRIFSSSLPAHWVYPEMGAKTNQGTDAQNLNQLTASAGAIISHGENGNPLGGITLSNTLQSLPWYSDSYADDRGVVQASAVVYQKNNYASGLNDIQDGISQMLSSEELTELNKRYLMRSSYAFSGDKTNANLDGGDDIVMSGRLTNYYPFDWDDPEEFGDAEYNWKVMQQIDAFNENGTAVNSHVDIYTTSNESSEIHQCVKFNGDGNLVQCTAANAKFNSVTCENFEDDINATDAVAHTGDKSYVISSGNSWTSESVKVSQNIVENGGLIQFWVQRPNQELVEDLEVKVNGQLTSGNFDMPKRVSQVGKWELFRVNVEDISAYDLVDGDEFSIQIKYEGYSLTYLDDFRFCPKESVMTTYVYEPDEFRLVATLDDQNFAQIFQYNLQGQLIRKVIETERGLKTIEESQYNSPTVLR